MAFEPETGNSISKKGRVHETGLDGYVSINNGNFDISNNDYVNG